MNDKVKEIVVKTALAGAEGSLKYLATVDWKQFGPVVGILAPSLISGLQEYLKNQVPV